MSTALAIKYSRTFNARALRLGAQACVFVDGQPKPGLSVNTFEIEDIEAVEVYGPRGDRTGTLGGKWPPMAPCGDTGMPATGRGDDRIQWIALWLKH